VQGNWLAVARQSGSFAALGWQQHPTSIRRCPDGLAEVRVSITRDIGTNVQPTAEYSARKDVPIHLQLVHTPSGWCSGLSDGFIVRSKASCPAMLGCLV